MERVGQADVLGLGHIALDKIGSGTGFFDYDNDRRLDLFVANGSTFQKGSDPSLLVLHGGRNRDLRLTTLHRGAAPRV